MCVCVYLTGEASSNSGNLKAADDVSFGHWRGLFNASNSIQKTISIYRFVSQSLHQHDTKMTQIFLSIHQNVTKQTQFEYLYTKIQKTLNNTEGMRSIHNGITGTKVFVR